MPTTNLKQVKKSNASSVMPEGKTPAISLIIDNKNENVLKATGKGTSAIVLGYNKGKPNMDASSIICFTKGIGTEKDNIEFDPSLILNHETQAYATTPSHVISSCVDVRLRSFGKDFVAQNRSAVMSNADIIQHRGNELIELVVGNSLAHSTGDRITSTGGVRLIYAGQENNLQPMALGSNLVRAFYDLASITGDLATRIVELRKDIGILKTALLAHVHIATGPGAPVSPSVDLPVTVAPSFLNDAKEVGNSMSTKFNFEIFKNNYLMPSSKSKIFSSHHKLT